MSPVKAAGMVESASGAFFQPLDDKNDTIRSSNQQEGDDLIDPSLLIAAHQREHQ